MQNDIYVHAWANINGNFDLFQSFNAYNDVGVYIFTCKVLYMFLKESNSPNVSMQELKTSIVIQFEYKIITMVDWCPGSLLQFVLIAIHRTGTPY